MKLRPVIFTLYPHLFKLIFSLIESIYILIGMKFVMALCYILLFQSVKENNTTTCTSCIVKFGGIENSSIMLTNLSTLQEANQQGFFFNYVLHTSKAST